MYQNMEFEKSKEEIQALSQMIINFITYYIF